MTFIVGMTCCDGIVLCTDSLEDDGITKKTVDKIKMIGSPRSGVAIAGAGPGRIIDKFGVEAGAKISRGPFTQKAIENAIEEVLAEFDSKYVKTANDQFAVIVAVYSQPGFHRLLYEGSGLVLSPVMKECRVGVGNELWRLVSDNLYTPRNCVADNVRLAIFATQLAIKYASGVDEPIQIVSYTFGDQSWRGYSPTEINAIAADLPLHGFKDALRRYWNINNPPTRSDQMTKYGIVKTPGDEVTSLDGVKPEALRTISGRTRALKIFDRNRDRLQKRAKLEQERTSVHGGGKQSP